MRTRFIGRDCFFSKSKDQTVASSHFNPIYLHAPDPSDPDPNLDFEFRSFSICEEIRLDSNITVFPVKNAISALLSAFVPDFQQVDQALDLPALSEKELEDLLYADSIGVHDARFKPGASKSKISRERKLEKILEFDLLEMDLPQRETVRVREKENGLDLCFGLNIKVPLGIINNQDLEITVPYKENLLIPVYKIEKLPFEFDQDERVLCTDQGFNYRAKITKFELKDSSVSEQDIISIAENKPFNSLISTVDLVNLPCEEDLLLSPTRNNEILLYISENPKLEPCEDFNPIALNTVLDMDIIEINDNILVKNKSNVYELKPDGTHSDSPCNISLQEIEIMDFNYNNNNNNNKIFEDLKEINVDNTSEELLKNEIFDKSEKFYDSIISSELVLVDEIFKSLPTPVISDEKINISLNIVIPEIICEMKLCPNSASDGIYLDWHLLIEGTCNSKICSGYTSVVKEINKYNLQDLLKEYEEIVDIIGLVLDENMEKIKINNKGQIGFNENLKSFEEELVVQKEKNYDENNGKNNWENIGEKKASMLSKSKSMNQENELNFFLGARRGTSIRDANSKKESCLLTAPAFVQNEQSFLPKEPVFVQKGPVYLPKKPVFVQKEPVFVQKEPVFTPNEPVYLSKEPVYLPKEPVFVPNEPIESANTIKDPLEKIANYKSEQKRTINLFNFTPQKHHIYDIIRPTNAPSLLNPNPAKLTKPSLKDTIIIVNTKSINKPTLTSRRSSYQKLLNLEKQGASVIERDISTPLDVVFSAAVCLIWYKVGGFMKMSANINEGPSCIKMFIENVSTNVLMDLSYSFSTCIMIFEGEINIITAIMDLSSTLYSAAANLDMNLQLLWSHSSESTDDIIMTCLVNLSGQSQPPKFDPPVQESETLAESFLTKFPSVNTLTAHAILNCCKTLVDFFEWSTERRVEELVKYFVNPESVVLFSALSRFGESGESKSVMTSEFDYDSGYADSELSSSLIRSPLKRTRFDYEKDEGIFANKPFEKVEDDLVEFNFVEGKKNKSVSSIVDQVLGRNNKGAIRDFNEEVIAKKGVIREFNEEIRDYKKAFSEKKAFNSELCNFASRPSKRPVFGHQTFPTSAEIEEETTSNYNSQKRNNNNNNFIQNFNTNLSPIIGLEQKFQNSNSKPGKPVRRFEFRDLGETEKRSSSSSTSTKSQETYSKTRSPSIIDSSRYKAEKGKKVENLNYRHQGEKGKKVENLNYQNKGEKGKKVENSKYKYQVNPINQKWKEFKFEPVVEISKSEKSKRERIPTWSPCEKRERENQDLISPTWTPVDKRARQNLSFTRQGKAKQSKLVWRKKDSPCISVSLGKRSFQNI